MSSRTQLRVALDSLATASAIIEGLPDAAILLDEQLNVVAHNAAYSHLSGLRPRALRKALEEQGPFALICSDPDRDRAEALAVLEDRRLRRFDEVPLHVTGASDLIAILCFIPVHEEGKSAGVVVLYRDVSAEARMQERYKALVERERARAEELERLVAERTSELAEALEAVTRLARTDPLTGVQNRRAFMEGLDHLIALARRHGRKVALLMCDLDFFKRLNDTFGHTAGDTVLKETATALATAIRDTDTIGRFGGEEFIIVLPETAHGGAEIVATRCVESIRNLPLAELVPGAGQQTISIGCAVFPEHADDASTLIARADEALYERKEAGRDGLTMYVGKSPAVSPA